MKLQTKKMALLASLLLLAACTKALPNLGVDSDYSSVARVESKTLIDQNAEYIYVPSSLYSSRTTDATFPMYMGEAKIVKLTFDENNIQVNELDPEAQFDGNQVNNKPVLSIPIAHVDYKCALDSYGKCTNKQEIDNSKPWAQRSLMQLQPDHFAVQEINFLPVDIANIFYPCYQVVSSNFLNYKLENDALNIDVEKTYHTDASSPACQSNTKSLDDLTFSVIYHYSLVKLKSIVSPDYKPFVYSHKEEGLFGFFDTDTMKLDVDDNNMQTSQTLFLNRINPSKKTVTYYLTDNFTKPQYAKLKLATQTVFNNINKTLGLAGANFKLELKDAPTGFNPGDIRYNSIIMVEEPVNYGILGYGPTAANPRTGEILSGHVAMYMGVMLTSLERAYEDVLAEKQSAMAAAMAKTTTTANPSTGEIKISGASAGPMTLAPALMQPLPEISKTTSALANKSTGDLSQKLSLISARANQLNVHKVSLREIMNLEDNDLARDQIMSLHCYYNADAANVEGAIENDIDGVLKAVNYKPWLQLSEEERSKVIDALMPFLWIPTLTHEMGHNLGLRHNFAGSEDKDNFYSADELKAMGITRQFAYSSVMDYGYHSTKELQVMGKYDIAALRYAYAEKVELKDGSLATVAKYRSDSLNLKTYKFCTDEHVDVNPNCKRFDEGTSLTEIANHWITYYEDTYRRRNFRNGMFDFSLYNDTAAISRLNGILFNLRMIFERYDDIKQTFGVADDAPEWATIDFLKDLKAATLVGANFYLQILQTPDTLCAVAKDSDPNTILGAIPLRQLSSNALSCLDKTSVQLKAGYSIVGQAGRAFQSKKDPNSDNPYLDQVDVRGVWLNKLLAIKMLLMRKTGVEPYDVYTDNYLDMADVRDKVQSTLSGLLLDQVVAPVPIYTTSGQTLVARMQVKMYDKSPAQNPHLILNPLAAKARAAFGLPNDNIEFQAQLANMMKKYLPSPDQLNDPNSLLNSIQVRTSLSVGENAANFLTSTVGLQTLFVNKQSNTAVMAVADENLVETLDRLGDDKVNAIIADLTAGKAAAADASADVSAAYALGASTLQKYESGGFDDRSLYQLVLRTLAK